MTDLCTEIIVPELFYVHSQRGYLTYFVYFILNFFLWFCSPKGLPRLLHILLLKLPFLQFPILEFFFIPSATFPLTKCFTVFPERLNQILTLFIITLFRSDSIQHLIRRRICAPSSFYMENGHIFCFTWFCLW